MPYGNTLTISRMTTPTPVRQYWVARASASCSHVNAAAPSSGPEQRVLTPEQHHHQRVDRARYRERVGRRAAFRVGEQSAGHAREAAGDRERLDAPRADIDSGRRRAQRTSRGSPRSA